MSLDLNRKNAKTQTAYSFRYIVNIAKFKYYQGAKFEATVSRNSLDYIIYIKVMMAQARIFIHFLCCISSILCKNSNYVLRIIKKGGAICKKIRTLLVSF